MDNENIFKSQYTSEEIEQAIGNALNGGGSDKEQFYKDNGFTHKHNIIVNDTFNGIPYAGQIIIYNKSETQITTKDMIDSQISMDLGEIFPMFEANLSIMGLPFKVEGYGIEVIGEAPIYGFIVNAGIYTQNFLGSLDGTGTQQKLVPTLLTINISDSPTITDTVTQL